MAIINGNYVPDTLGTAQAAQQQVFGDYSKKDMSDYSTAAYNYLMKQQEQAHDLELWKMTNEYNLPSAQMQRYQDAGLNPNLVYSQQQQASAPPAFSAPTFHPTGAKARSTQQQLGFIQQIQNLAQSARETFDYLTYGRTEHALRNGLLAKQYQLQDPIFKKTMNEAYMSDLRNLWEEYMQTGQGGWQDPETGEFHSFREGPRGQMTHYQTQVQMENFERLKYMVNILLPSQKARNDALIALDKYQKDFMEGKYSAVLDLDLGLGDTFNQWAKMFLFMGLARMF